MRSWWIGRDVGGEDMSNWEDKIVILLEDEKLRWKMGEAGLEKVKEFTWDKIAEQTVGVYREILGVKIDSWK